MIDVYANRMIPLGLTASMVAHIEHAETPRSKYETNHNCFQYIAFYSLQIR